MMRRINKKKPFKVINNLGLMPSGKGWHEGETTRDDYMNGVDAGKYHFEINVFGENKRRFKWLNIDAKTSRPMDWNFLVTALVIIGLCLIVGFANHSYEKSRYGIGSDDDE
jgi:hypothetical protein